MDEVVRSNGGRRGLPDDYVPQKSRCAGKVTTDSGEIEGGYSVYETFESAILDAAIFVRSNRGT